MTPWYAAELNVKENRNIKDLNIKKNVNEIILTLTHSILSSKTLPVAISLTEIVIQSLPEYETP